MNSAYLELFANATGTSEIMHLTKQGQNKDEASQKVSDYPFDAEEVKMGVGIILDGGRKEAQLEPTPCLLFFGSLCRSGKTLPELQY